MSQAFFWKWNLWGSSGEKFWFPRTGWGLRCCISNSLLMWDAAEQVSTFCHTGYQGHVIGCGDAPFYTIFRGQANQGKIPFVGRYLVFCLFVCLPLFLLPLETYLRKYCYDLWMNNILKCLEYFTKLLKICKSQDAQADILSLYRIFLFVCS